MKKCDIVFLVSKYRKERLKGKQIFNRIRDHFEMEDYIKFKRKYLR
jgi:hypothetical protein